MRQFFACLPLLAAFLAFAAPAGAQQYPLVEDHPGSWQTTGPIKPDFTNEVTAEERTAAAAWVNDLVAILRHAPHLAPPAGFQVVPHAKLELDNLDRADDSKRPSFVTADVTLNLAPYERAPRGVEAVERDTAATIEIRINDITPLGGTEMADRFRTWQDAEGRFVQDAGVATDTRHGFPVFQEGNLDTWVVIRRNDVPFYAPVTRERYLRLFTTYAESDLADMQRQRAKIVANLPAMAGQVDGRIADLRHQIDACHAALTAMSPGDRRLAAVVGDSEANGPPSFLAADDTTGRPVVFVNPALMDARLPRSAPQILAVRVSANDAWPGLAEALDAELDWAALTAMVHAR